MEYMIAKIRKWNQNDQSQNISHNWHLWLSWIEDNFWLLQDLVLQFNGIMNLKLNNLFQFSWLVETHTFLSVSEPYRLVIPSHHPRPWDMSQVSKAQQTNNAVSSRWTVYWHSQKSHFALHYLEANCSLQGTLINVNSFSQLQGTVCLLVNSL